MELILKWLTYCLCLRESISVSWELLNDFELSGWGSNGVTLGCPGERMTLNSFEVALGLDVDLFVELTLD